MEGIFKMLESEGIEVNDEVKKRLNKKIASEYKTIAEFSELKRKLEETTEKVSKYSNIENELNTLKNKNDELSKLYETSKTNEYKLYALKKGINEKFVDFVTSEVLNQTNEEKDFKSAFEEYSKDNPQYMNSQNSVKLSTTPKLENKSEFNGSSNEAINNFIRGKFHG